MTLIIRLCKWKCKVKQMFDTQKDILTINDICEVLRIGRNSAYKLVNDGKIASIKIGKIHRIPKVYLINYIENNSEKNQQNS